MLTCNSMTDGNFADYSEIMAKNYSAKAVAGDEEAGQAMPGEIDPGCRMTTQVSWKGDNTHVRFYQ